MLVGGRVGRGSIGGAFGPYINRARRDGLNCV